MANTKIMIFGGIATVIIGLIIAGGGLWLSRRHQHQPVAAASTKTLAANTNETEPETQPASSATGLNFDGSTGQSAAGQTQTAQPSQTAQSKLDPATFAQYDKYKAGDKALFAELQTGTGAVLGTNQTATVAYKGWLTNGQLFDSSKLDSDGKLQAFSFTMGQHQVIAGWEQAMAGMKVGGVRLLIIPPAVGYGPDGQGPIPGNSVLVFQVQLLGVQ
jgi:FKBP-type peptidyl-prolyl cis-trans isomerase